MKNLISLFICVSSSCLISCSSDKSLSSSSEPSYLLISSGDLNHAGVTSYNVDGSLKENIINFRNFGSAAYGLAPHLNSTFLASVSGSDALLNIGYEGTQSVYYGSSDLNGNIYDMEYGPVTDYYYVVESNNIEVFDSSGNRLATAIIPTTLGSCVLSNPRNMHATEDGFLYVASYSNNRILKYNISEHIATCDSSFDVPGISPHAVIKHSNGLLYISSWSNDAVYTYDEMTSTLTNIFQPGLLVLSDPTALVELPDQSVLVASSNTDSIEKIDATGVRDGVQAFLSDIYTLNVTDMEIVNY